MCKVNIVLSGGLTIVALTRDCCVFSKLFAGCWSYFEEATMTLSLEVTIISTLL